MAALKDRQREIAMYGATPYRWTLVSGPQGCGKTHAGLTGLVLKMRMFSGVDFGVTTKTRKQMKSALRGGIDQIMGEEMAGDDEVAKIPNGHGGYNNLISFVADNKAAEKRMRSFNLAGMLVDEATTLPDGIVAAANARCRVGRNPQLLVLTNPDGPLHPLKVNYFDCPHDINGKAVWCDIWDNPTMTQAMVDSMSKAYTGCLLYTSPSPRDS